MRSTSIAALSCLLPFVAATGGSKGCNADNCFRAVRASAFPTRIADCGSYLLATVTPATSTITSTIVATTLPTEAVEPIDDGAPPASPVTVYPTSVPAYASPCSGSVRYSSACSCAGVTQSTTTAAAPSTTVYVTECSLPSPAAEACGSVLQASNSRNYEVQCGVAYTGDSSLSVVTAGSFQECFNACEGNSACGTFTFDSAQCSDNCKLFGIYDLPIAEGSLTASSGFTPGTARDGTCGTGVCGTAVLGETYYQDSYLVACRSSYSFAQRSDVRGSPFTATSFRDCLRQCDDIYDCNYMSFDSSKFIDNCAMFSRGGVSKDFLASNPYVDSAKALVQTGGPSGIRLLADSSECPVYDESTTCQDGSAKTPIHPTSFTYTASCKIRITPKRGAAGSSVKTSTLTVNTYDQCFDACDKNNGCSFMNFAKSSLTTIDNCQFLSGYPSNVNFNPNDGYDSLSYNP